jgi:hypothetical protein
MIGRGEIYLNLFRGQANSSPSLYFAADLFEQEYLDSR